MSKEKVISREYKLVLKKNEFEGHESSLVEKAKYFWNILSNNAKPLKCSGNLKDIGVKREIRFYDTAISKLHENDYIFRERKEEGNDKKEITLKFRHPDRHISQHRNMLPKKIGKGEMKFEEDIKPKFQTLYSYSSTQDCKDDQKFESLNDILRFYPGIENDLPQFDKEEKLQMVNELQVQELVIKGGEILLSKSPEEKAECALIIWYDLMKAGPDPLIVEFSFRYGSKKEKYNRELSQNAYNLYSTIQDKMASWLDQDGNTKTSFLYKK